jgi:hypothetical protein
MTPLQTSTTVGLRQSTRETVAGTLGTWWGFGARAHLRGMERFDFREQRDQAFELGGAELARDLGLSALPVPGRVGQRGAAGAGYRYLASAPVPPWNDLDPTALDERVERAREGGAIEQHRFGKDRHARASHVLQGSQERELGDPQPGRRHHIVVELRQRAARPAKAAAGAGGGER